MEPRCFKGFMAGVPLAWMSVNPADKDRKIWKHRTQFLKEPHGLGAASLHVCCIFLLLSGKKKNWLSVSYIFSLLVTQSCLILCNPTDCNLPGSSGHGILQARIVEWVVIPGDLPNPGLKLGSPALQADSLLSEPSGSLRPPKNFNYHVALVCNGSRPFY